MKIARTLLSLAAVAALCAAPASAGDNAAKPAAKAQLKSFTLTSKSEAAKQKLREIQTRIENFQGGTVAPLVDEILKLDPDFAMGHYYASATTFPPKLDELAKARELAKNASEGERRFIEAMALARGDKPEAGVEPLRALANDYPGERVVHVILGQVLAGLGRVDEARASYERAIAVDASTPRAHTLAANLYLLQGDYAKARATLEGVLPTMPKTAAPTQARYGIAFSHLYEGDPDKALATLHTLVDEYKTSGAAENFPEVFIWNSIARINLENGRLEEAMKAYDKGYESVPGSKIDDEQKQIWYGRLHHGRARTLARMGKHEEAWKQAETIKKMIDDGGDKGKPFLPAWHYVAGYLMLEKGDAKAAVEHLTQADKNDPFHMLLLARAYEKAGDKENAKKTYQVVVSSNANGLERALSYREAKQKLSAL
jgi:tetratricopeptide (TPR) repeat protein